MKKRLIISILLLFAISGFADMPGNTPREAVNVLVRLGELQGYTIYANGPYANYGEDDPVNDSAVILLNGGFGAPPCVNIFGVNARDQYTDTVVICNDEQGDQVLMLRVENGRLVSEISDDETKEDVIPVLENSPETPADDEVSGKIRLLSLVALASMIMLVAGYFIKQRKEQAV